jgi:glycogen operon protein
MTPPRWRVTWPVSASATSTARDCRGQRVIDQSILLLFNADHEPIDWGLLKQWGDHWQVSFDTTDPARDGRTTEAGVPFPVAGHSVVVLGRAEAPS